MYNSVSFNEPVQLLPCTNPTHYSNNSMSRPANKFVYVKQNFAQCSEMEPVKVLVNPNFNKKVFINPNFNNTVKNIAQPAILPKIHINPNVQNIKFNSDNQTNIKKIHVNPNVLRNALVPINGPVTGENCKHVINSSCEKVMNAAIISTRTKLVRLTAKNIPDNKIRKRRSSIRSQFKIIKSSVLETNVDKNLNRSKYRLTSNKYTPYSKVFKGVNKFKIDNRPHKPVEKSPRSKKYVYINRFLNISDIARNNLLKQNRNKYALSSGSTHYKKLSNGMKINPYKKTNNLKKVQENGIRKSKYKFLRKSSNGSVTSKKIINQLNTSLVRHKIVKKNTAKLRICNIPCPYYRKFGRCKGKENGKCSRKHDPDQIALCTKFLQGACLNNHCFLSHNVSPEKMPACKFYLEGSCSREDCPYLHVRISPKAEVCRNFLEGFCKKAAKCDKRHQLLCPDYEKNGTCQKQRCPYPHGKMVRKYSVFNKNKFAKKSSNNCPTKPDGALKDAKTETLISSESCEGNTKPRYYIGQNLDNEGKQSDTVQRKNDEECIDIKNRPQLGKLPSFIAFENI